jgi:hypothetical protein
MNYYELRRFDYDIGKSPQSDGKPTTITVVCKTDQFYGAFIEHID